MVRNLEEAYRDISTAFGDIIRRLQARTVVLNGDELFIISEKVLFWLPIDRDGLDLWYVRQDARGGFQAYRLGMELAHRAQGTITANVPSPKTWREEIAAGAQWNARALEALGEDVLAGDQRWIQEFERAGGKPFPLPPALAAAIGQALAARRP
ncbi:MAG: hypothetical protein K8S99_03160 [Planctomycetes bacterium]|nr:hypothetical protein [Planctomycetota bacterium]